MLSNIQELRQSITSSNVSDTLRFSQEFGKKYDAESLAAYRASISQKLQQYQDLKVNAQENQARLRLKLEKLRSLSQSIQQQGLLMRQFASNLLPQAMKSLLT